MDFLKIYGKEDIDSLPSGLWGIKDPALQWKESIRQSGTSIVLLGCDTCDLQYFAVLEDSSVELDLILVPG